MVFHEYSLQFTPYLFTNKMNPLLTSLKEGFILLL
jgi:hypothetical protein